MADNFDPIEYQAQQQQLLRRQRMAEMLLQKSMQPLSSGQMVGRFFVPTNPLQQLAQTSGQLYASKQLGDIDAETAKNRERLINVLRGQEPQTSDQSAQQNQQPQQQSQSQQPQQSPQARQTSPTGLNPMALNLMLTGDPTFTKIGSEIQQTETPIALREGDLVNRNGRLIYSNPKTVANTQLIRDDNGKVIGMQPIPGADSSLTSLTAAQEAGKAPYELIDVTLPNGQIAKIPKSSIVGGQKGLPNPQIKNPGTGMTPGLVSGQTTTGKEEQGERGKHFADLEKTIDNDAIVAQQGNVKLGELQDLVKSFAPGKAAPIKQWLTEWAAASHLPIDKRSLEGASDMEAFNKIALGLATQQAKQLSSRPSQLEFQKMVEANPNISLLPEGLQKIIVFNKYQNDLALQKQAEKEKWLGQNGSMQGFESSWNKQMIERQKLQEAQNAKTIIKANGSLTKNPDGSYNYVPGR